MSYLMTAKQYSISDDGVAYRGPILMRYPNYFSNSGEMDHEMRVDFEMSMAAAVDLIKAWLAKEDAKDELIEQQRAVIEELKKALDAKEEMV